MTDIGCFTGNNKQLFKNGKEIKMENDIVSDLERMLEIGIELKSLADNREKLSNSEFFNPRARLHTEKDAILTKYSAPFSPSDLLDWGWERDEKNTTSKFYTYDKGDWVIYFYYDGSMVASLKTIDCYIGSIPKTQIEMQMLLDLITGGENG